jgi:nucleotide-binding universal stress UspA family protein
MFRNILVAIDGSKTSEQALSAALEEARLWKAHLHVMYVIETGLFSSLPMDNTWEVMYSMLENEGKKALEHASELGKEKGVQVTTYMKQGHAGNSIVDTAEETGADVVIVGSHGKSEVDRLLLGSVSSFVVAHAKVSVLVVRS